MPIFTQTSAPRLRYHTDAYDFVFDALHYTQGMLHRLTEETDVEFDEESAHISGRELLEGIRKYALDQFGLMTSTVFSTWGISSTDDFGRMVFELVEEGRMRKTDRDDISDFYDVYDFAEVFDRAYEPSTTIPASKK
ncbi:MAG: hypothetical protein KDA86_17670 [Planctomycetaceae bacterium]|nr:hypothetical protein [Planctomycetaceae bacterium]